MRLPPVTKAPVAGALLASLAACGGGSAPPADRGPNAVPDGPEPRLGAASAPPPAILSTPLSLPLTLPLPAPVPPPAAEPPPDDGDRVLDTSPIADQLAPDALDDITFDDGEVPITQGSWLRLTPETSWAWQLKGPLDTRFEADVYSIDMISAIGRGSVETLHAQGRSVLCYFSVGTFEPWRPDVHLFDPADLAEPHAGFANERWLDPTSDRVVRIMINRMDMAVKIGCDGVELDNVDAFDHGTSWEVTREEQKRYVRILANAAHERNLAVAFKNSPGLIVDLIDWFDLAINESCHRFDECGLYGRVVAAGKPVFHAEYAIPDPVRRQEMCVLTRALGLRTLVLPEDLNGSFRFSCDD